MNSLKNDHLIGSVALRCDCLCSTLVIDKLKFDFDGTTYYNLSFQDSAENWGCNTVKERVKAAWYMLTRRPYVHADLFIEDNGEFKEFVDNLTKLEAL